MTADTILHPEFKPEPFWWEAYRPVAGELVDLPGKVRVAIVGAGYGGLATALELHKLGVEVVVLEAKELGHGASTRSGGAVSGGVNVGKSFAGKSLDPNSQHARDLLVDAGDAFSTIERLVAEEGIDCAWQKTGRFVGAWTRKHFVGQAARVARLNDAAKSECYMIPAERQREEMASDYYHGGMVVERAACLHPAMYYKGLLDAVRRRGIPVCAMAPVETIRRENDGWRVRTGRGAQCDDAVRDGGGAVQCDDGVPGGVSLHHDGSAQCQGGAVERAGGDRAAVGFLCR
jgi:glycine/D-amino acid oxidase-like deaminating enzyme